MVLPAVTYSGLYWRVALAAVGVLPHVMMLGRCMARSAQALLSRAPTGPALPFEYEGLLPEPLFLHLFTTVPWVLPVLAGAVAVAASVAGSVAVACVEARQRAHFLRRIRKQR